MKKFTFVLLLSLLFTTTATAQQLSFPGAEGWGRFATGGRATNPATGSKVYYVTSLEDCPDDNLKEGTLRWALRDGDSTPRTILFKVAGTIRLTGKLKFAHPNVTLAGQSAPGRGICISGANIYVCQNNVIIRYIRFRAGDLAESNYSALDIENSKDVIIDHCSFSWSMEENVTMYDNQNTTMQWCILSEPLYYSRHKKGERGYGSQWGGERSTYHHNLLAHCVSRTPRINGARDKTPETGTHDQFVDTELINNVIYNWGNKGGVYGGELEAIVNGAYSRTNLINNYYKPGPATNTFQERWFADLSHTASKATGAGQWYIDGNMFEANEYINDKNKGDHSKVNADNWLYADQSNSQKAVNIRLGINFMDSVRLKIPSANSGLDRTSASQAYVDVIAKAGARLPETDEIDTRILSEAAGDAKPIFHGNFKPAYIGIIDSQNDLKPAGTIDSWTAWPDLSAKQGEVIAADTDEDGIPDSWEDENGLDKNNAGDGARIAGNGYSNLENYLNGLTVETSGTGNLSADKLAVSFYYKAHSNAIIFSSGQYIARLELINMTGERVTTLHLHAESGEIVLPEIPSGIYCIRWIQKDGASTGGKVLISR